jgi:very-long-chain ceramide synthase
VVIPYFISFIGAWTYLRHYQNLRILASMLPLPSPFPDDITAQITDVTSNLTSNAHKFVAPLAASFTTLFPETATLLASAVSKLSFTRPSQFASFGPYELNWDTQQYKCWISQWITFWLLAALQAVNCFWLFLIIRILWRVVRTVGQEMEDERSEYDSDEEEERQAELRAEKQEEKLMGNGHAKHG